MTGFEPMIWSVGSDRSTSWATTTFHCFSICFILSHSFILCPPISFSHSTSYSLSLSFYIILALHLSLLLYLILSHFQPSILRPNNDIELILHCPIQNNVLNEVSAALKVLWRLNCWIGNCFKTSTIVFLSGPPTMASFFVFSFFPNTNFTLKL